ncbi:MAG: hypothetical protein ABH883_00145 [Candidatus Omnitrophota bacterium]
MSYYQGVFYPRGQEKIITARPGKRNIEMEGMVKTVKRKKNGFIKIADILLCVVFFLSSVPAGYGSDVSLEGALEKIFVPEGKSRAPGGICLPGDLGEIKDFMEGRNGKVIFHILDAHCNYSAQRSICGLLDEFGKEYGVSTVFLEGGKGEYDLSVFTGIADEDVRREVSEYFLRQGRISGAEYYAVNNPGRIRMRGIEDERLYLNNLEDFRRSAAMEKEKDGMLARVSDLLDKLSGHCFSSEDNSLIGMLACPGKGQEFEEQLKFILAEAEKRNISLEPFRNVSLMRELFERGKRIDFVTAGKQRGDIIRSMRQCLGQSAKDRLAFEALRLERGETTPAAFYRFLTGLAEFRGLAGDRREELAGYLGYLEMYEKLDGSALLDEAWVIKGLIAETLTVTDVQKEIWKWRGYLPVLKKLFGLELSRDEFDVYYASRGEYSLEKFKALCGSIPGLIPEDYLTALDPDMFERVKGVSEEFYAGSFSRDNVFFRRIEEDMRLRRADKAILVTGGFHAGNMKSIFSKAGYTCVTIMPRIDGKDLENPYYGLLAGRVSPVESMVTAAISNLAVASMLSEMGITGTEEKSLFDISVKVMEALVNEASRKRPGGATLMIENIGYIRLTTRPKDRRAFNRAYPEIDVTNMNESERALFDAFAREHQEIGRIMIGEGEKAVFAVREDLRDGAVYKEGEGLSGVLLIHTGFDGDKLTYKGHQAVVDLFLRKAHDKGYDGLHAVGLADFLAGTREDTPAAKIASAMSEAFGAENYSRLLEMAGSGRDGKAKRWINVIAGARLAPVPWKIGSRSDEYGINISLARLPEGEVDAAWFVDTLLHELNSAANPEMEHADNNPWKSAAGIKEILDKIEKRLSAGEFAFSIISSPDALFSVTDEALKLFRRKGEAGDGDVISAYNVIFPDGYAREVSYERQWYGAVEDVEAGETDPGAEPDAVIEKMPVVYSETEEEKSHEFSEEDDDFCFNVNVDLFFDDEDDEDAIRWRARGIDPAEIYTRKVSEGGTVKYYGQGTNRAIDKLIAGEAWVEMPEPAYGETPNKKNVRRVTRSAKVLSIDGEKYIIAREKAGGEQARRSLRLDDLMKHLSVCKPRTMDEAVRVFAKKSEISVREIEEWAASPYIVNVIEEGLDISDEAICFSLPAGSEARQKAMDNRRGFRSNFSEAARQFFADARSISLNPVKRGDFALPGQADKSGREYKTRISVTREGEMKTGLCRIYAAHGGESDHNGQILRGLGEDVKYFINRELPVSYGAVIGGMPARHKGAGMEGKVFEAALARVKSAGRNFISEKKIGRITVLNSMGVSEALEVLAEEKRLPLGNPEFVKTKIDITIAESVLEDICGLLDMADTRGEEIARIMEKNDLARLKMLKAKMNGVSLRDFLRKNAMLTIVKDKNGSVIYPVDYNAGFMLALSGLNLGYVIERIEGTELDTDMRVDMLKDALTLRTKAMGYLTGDINDAGILFSSLWEKMKDSPADFLNMTFELYLPEVKAIDVEEIVEKFYNNADVVYSL